MLYLSQKILKILARSIVLDEEDSSENLELVECRWKDNLTFPSVYWVISLIKIFGFGGCGGWGCVTPSSIQSFGKVISLHWMVLGTTVIDLERLVLRSRVSPFVIGIYVCWQRLKTWLCSGSWRSRRLESILQAYCNYGFLFVGSCFVRYFGLWEI